MLRLSELLERLRPAGTPGAATDGEQQRHRELLEAEIAGITTVLHSFEADAEQVIADGRARAERVRHDGERHVERIRTGLPDRVAVARAQAVRGQEESGEGEVARVRRDAEDEIERINADADERIPGLVDTVVATIWSAVTAVPDDVDDERHPEQEDGP